MDGCESDLAEPSSEGVFTVYLYPVVSTPPLVNYSIVIGAASLDMRMLLRDSHLKTPTRICFQVITRYMLNPKHQSNFANRFYAKILGPNLDKPREQLFTTCMTRGILSLLVCSVEIFV